MSRDRSRSPVRAVQPSSRQLDDEQFGTTQILVSGRLMSGSILGEVEATIDMSVRDLKRRFSQLSSTPLVYLRLVRDDDDLDDEDLPISTLFEDEFKSRRSALELTVLRLTPEAPSFLAIYEDDPMMVHFLLTCSADPNESDEHGWTALHWAAHRKLPQVGETILSLESFEAVNDQDLGRSSALHVFAQLGWSNLCKAIALREDFTGLNIRGSQGNTALHWAARGGHEETCKALLALPHLTALNEQNMRGWTVLHYAAGANMLEACRDILAHPCFEALSYTTNDGETALHWAALHGHFEVCQLLLESGVNPASRDVEGLSAADNARRSGYEAVVSLLEAAEAAAQTNCEYLKPEDQQNAADSCTNDADNDSIKNDEGDNDSTAKMQSSDFNADSCTLEGGIIVTEGNDRRERVQPSDS